MGSRAVIQVTQPQSETSIFLYTHWAGEEIAQILASGIHKANEAGRLLDDSYAVRIIFDTLTQLEGGSTGYGIIIGEAPGDIQYETPHIFWPSFHEKPRVEYLGITHDALTFADFFDPVAVEATAS